VIRVDSVGKSVTCLCGKHADDNCVNLPALATRQHNQRHCPGIFLSVTSGLLWSTGQLWASSHAYLLSSIATVACSIISSSKSRMAFGITSFPSFTRLSCFESLYTSQIPKFPASPRSNCCQSLIKFDAEVFLHMTIG
jgi:hypothetical protein